MKIILSLIISNLIIFIWMYLMYLYPEYLWSLKIYIYVISVLYILSFGSVLTDRNLEFKQRFTEKVKSDLYMILDVIFSIITLIGIVILNLKLGFVLLLIAFMFEHGFKFQYRDELKKQEEE